MVKLVIFSIQCWFPKIIYYTVKKFNLKKFTLLICALQIVVSKTQIQSFYYKVVNRITMQIINSYTIYKSFIPISEVT